MVPQPRLMVTAHGQGASGQGRRKKEQELLCRLDVVLWSPCDPPIRCWGGRGTGDRLCQRAPASRQFIAEGGAQGRVHTVLKQCHWC